jgi:hypothetical protein
VALTLPSYPFSSGFKLGFSVRQQFTGLFWDFSTSTFVANPVTPLQALVEGTGINVGLYDGGIPGLLPASWTDGKYNVRIHYMEAPNSGLDSFVEEVYERDNAAVFPILNGTGTFNLNLNPNTAINATK